MSSKLSVTLILSLLVLIACNQDDHQSSSSKPLPPISDSNLNKTQPLVNSYAPVDVSPMDMSYFPADYPKLKMAGAVNTPPLARVIYSRPHLQGRHIFKEVLKYGEPWRLGANEATELQLFTNASIQGKNIRAGRYVLYCIPQPGTWTLVLNNNTDTWGLKPDSTRDVARFEVPVRQAPGSFEYFTMAFEKTNTGADLIMAWDEAEIRLPIRF